MYEVKTYHHKKAWRRGDLEDELAVEGCEMFKTLKSAKEYIAGKLRGKSNARTNYTKYSSYGVYFTGVSWTNENTGERCDEYYQFVIKKKALR